MKDSWQILAQGLALAAALLVAIYVTISSYQHRVLIAQQADILEKHNKLIQELIDIHTVQDKVLGHIVDKRKEKLQ